MLKGEIEILTAVALNKYTRKQISSNHLARSSPYIIPTIESLVRDGYIIHSQSKGYQLTAKGCRILLEFLPNNSINHTSAIYRFLHERQSRAKEAIKLIETLGIEYINKMED